MLVTLHKGEKDCIPSKDL